MITLRALVMWAIAARGGAAVAQGPVTTPACGRARPTPGAPSGYPTLRGPIVAVDSAPRGAGRVARRVLVRYRPPGGSGGRVWVSVGAFTRLVHCSGRAAAPTALRVGATVSVWTRGLDLSAPAQAAADTLAVERGPGR